MPSIEIVAVNQLHPTDFSHLPFAVVSETTLRSHRTPSSKFQHYFDKLSGVIYHLGNPDLKVDSKGRCFFAYKLLSRPSQEMDESFLEFAEPYRPHVAAMLEQLMRDSSVQRVIFTSDWQLGPDWVKHEPPIALDEFWRLHDSHHLLLNALYPINPSMSPSD
jgi:hypothetical protein